ncbi:MAG: acyltransferase [Gemmatimonadota bacterium]
MSAATRWHIPALDGVRGVAVSLVLLDHFWPKTITSGPFAAMASRGWLGVDLFFVLSGALISGILLRTRESPHFFRNFYARRTLRIFPLYYLFLTVCFIVFPVSQGGAYWSTPFMQAAGSPAWYVFYLTNFKLALTGFDSPHAIRILWSLAVEEHFYLLFPLAVWYCSRKQLVRLLWGAIGLAIAVRSYLLYRLPEQHEFQYLLTPARMDALALGCLLTLVLRSGASLPLPRWWAGAGVALLAVVGVTTRFSLLDPGYRSVGYTLVAIAFALLLGWVFLDPDGSGTRWLRWPPLRYLGTISYGVYVLHVFVGAAANDALDHVGLPTGLDAVRPFAKVAATLLVAAVSWHWFESPILRLKRRFDSPVVSPTGTSHSANPPA